MRTKHIIYIFATVLLSSSCNNTIFSKKDKFKTLEGTIWSLDYDVSDLDKTGKSGYGIYYPGLDSRKFEFISPSSVIVSDTYISNTSNQPKVRHLSYRFIKEDQRLIIYWDENMRFVPNVNKKTGIMVDNLNLTPSRYIIYRRVK